MQRIIIIGGGIAGLAAAYYAAKQTETPIEITLLEQADYFKALLNVVASVVICILACWAGLALGRQL